jgi:hypothetical protein
LASRCSAVSASSASARAALGPLTLGHIVDHQVEAVNRAVRLGVGYVGARDRARTAIRIRNRRLELDAFARECALHVWLERGVPGFAKHFAQWPPEQLQPGPRKPLLVRLVVEAVPLLPVDEANQDRHRVGQLSHPAHLPLLSLQIAAALGQVA